MCGIAGGHFKNGVDDKISKASDTLTHRGPDAIGCYTDPSGKIFLGHHRLSIIDLSITANQPMYSSCGRYVMVYNGEVYNYKELRCKLPGHLWKTHGDTEVILELFAFFGEEMFAWLNGMFVLAIYDNHAEKLILARDPLGIKPLFYYQDDQDLVFASELKAIRKYLSLNNCTPPVNKDAIPYFLHLGFIPEPLSIYRNVYKFPSGQYAVFQTGNGEMNFTEYWSQEKCIDGRRLVDENIALTQYKDILFSAVESQMVGDVPFGTFLSGGIDSSLITAVSSQVSSQKVKTFSIGFEESKYDESIYASAVARHLKTEHYEFKVSLDDVLDLVPSLLDVYDEPFADSSAFPTMLVSKLARQHVTVTLSGDGGDETFFGYGMYTWAKRLSQPYAKVLRKPIYAATKYLGNRYRRAGRLFDYPVSSRIQSHIFSQEQYFFSEQEIDKILVKPAFDFTSLNAVDQKIIDPAEKQALWDIGHYLKDDLLVKVDRASMHYSLETRVPLLDMKLVEFALNLDHSLKIKKGYGTKYLMKKVLYEMVPSSFFNRPKRGFAIPLQEWLLGPLNCLLTDYLNKKVVVKHQIVHFAEVESLLIKFKNGKHFLYNRLWNLVILHWWLETNTQ